MTFIRYTYVDARTGVPVTGAPPRHGPRPPDLPGLTFGFALESEYPTETPTLYGQTEADDAAALAVPGVLAVVSEGEYDAASDAEMAARLVKRREALSAAIDTERNRRVYLPIGPVDVRGDGTLFVEPDIRNARDEANLVSLSLRCTQLAATGVTDPVVPFGAADNVEYGLTPQEMIALAAAPFGRASALYVRARQMKGAVAAAGLAALDDIDVSAGSIDGAGGWPG
jgi:hypothetical protein